MTDQVHPEVAASEKAPVPPATTPTHVDRAINYVCEVGSLSGRPLLARLTIVVFISWVLAQLVSLIVESTFRGPSTSGLLGSDWRSLVGMLVVAPIGETYLMRLTFVLFRRFSQKIVPLSVASAILWWILHLPTESWGLHALWLFFILSLIYLSLEKGSVLRAIAVTSVIHAVCNFLSVVLYYLIRAATG